MIVEGFAILAIVVPPALGLSLVCVYLQAQYGLLPAILVGATAVVFGAAGLVKLVVWYAERRPLP
jgi:ABC-type transport system involved in Fe-S cluster assembly fused permease/ATPase subunit